MKYTVFSGCSLTQGEGFELTKNEPSLWVNQIYNNFFSNTIKLNVGAAGRSNAGIFQDTIKALVSYPVEYIIVQWTSLNRHELELGFELYATKQFFIPNVECLDHNLHLLNYSKTYLNSIRDRFLTLAHPLPEILNIVEYTNSIVKLANLIGAKAFFINGLCPWDEDFFTKKNNLEPNQYTKYTQMILDADTRNSKEVCQLYEKLHNKLNDAGSINQSCWLNLYNSMASLKIDTNPDDLHPGIKSNNLYFELFSKALTTQLV